MEINLKTKFYAIIGTPISHSLSPLIHNSAFLHLGLNSYYLSFDLKKENLKDFISVIKVLDINGLSITIPHKIEIMNYLDEIDDEALEIGSVNTIKNKNGKLYGINTDIYGIEKSIDEKLNIQNKKVVIIGAGGAALSAVFVANKKKAKITILNRTIQKGEALAKKFNANFLPLENLYKLDYDLLINTTPIGMHPETNFMPIDKKLLLKNTYIMDIIYNPLKTKLLQEALKKECFIIDGLSMFIYQAEKQFEFWTNKKAPLEIMRKVVLNKLKMKS